MKIGIIGIGAVGSACRRGFEILGHEVRIHDSKFNTTIKNVINSDIVYVCVPTPEDSGGGCDLSIVKSVVQDLAKFSFNGVVAIKSTCTPGTTEQLINETNLKICFVPEFLKERSAVEDFVANHDLLAVGCHTEDIFKVVVESHGFFPKNVVMLTPTEAEILKYYSNAFNSTRIVFANIMFEICQKLNADYDKIKDTFLIRGTASPDYMDCNDSLRGYGGMCLPKDTRAITHLIKTLNLDFSLFDSVDNDNKKFKKTVFPGMRP